MDYQQHTPSTLYTYATCRKIAVDEGDIAKLTILIADFGDLSPVDDLANIIAELAGMENRSTILLMMCAFCKWLYTEIDPSGIALWNAVVTKQKENVETLLKFGACYKYIQFSTVDERTRLYDCVTDMNLEIVDCCNKNCEMCQC